MYARTNRCYNERGSRTSYVRSSIPYCMLLCILEDAASTDISNENYRLQCNRYLCTVFVNFYIWFFHGNNFSSILPVRVARGLFVLRRVCVVSCGTKIHDIISLSLSPPPTSPHVWGSVLILVLIYMFVNCNWVDTRWQ